MNKTININLASTFFHMDESAYAILKAYLNKLELAFKNTVGKDEILKDIETRIAELFQERKTNPDYVISEVDVNEIISILGQPQDFILEEDENSDHKETKSEKKLFRDPEDKYIGGVASGLGYYFGIDASWIRLLWILFALFSIGTLFPIYIILWIIIPEAKTTADQLKMKGKPINVDTIQKKIKKEFDEVSSKIKDVDYQKTTESLKKKSKSFFVFLEKILQQIPKIIAKLLGILFVFISSVGSVGIVIGTIIFIVFGSINWPFNLHFNFFNFSIFQSIYFTIALFLIFLIPFLFLFSLGMRLLNSQSSTFGTISRFVMFGLWISAILFIAIMSSQEIRNHNITATKTDIQKLSIKKTDTLFLASRLGDSVGNDQTWEYNNRSNTFNGVFGNLWEGKNKVKINLRQGDKSFSFMELKYSSNGATQEKAQKNAAKIFYNWSFTENVLDLDPLWEIAPSTPFYNQKLTINLHLQEGQVVFINKKLKPLLSSSIDNDQEFSRRQIIGHYWRMGSDKLECLDCLDNQQQLNIQYQDKSGEQKINLNVDNQGLTIKKK